MNWIGLDRIAKLLALLVYNNKTKRKKKRKKEKSNVQVITTLFLRTTIKYLPCIKSEFINCITEE